MSDHNQEIVAGKTDGSTGGCSDNPWDSVLARLNEGELAEDSDLSRVYNQAEKRRHT